MYMFKNAIINLNDPSESVYIYNFKHSTVYIQPYCKCNALLPFIIYLICKFIHPFILIFHQKVDNCIQCSLSSTLRK